jgi:hypothetical protein
MSCRLGSVEGVSPTTGIIVRLLPQLPVGTFFAVDLLQAEIFPVDI